MTLPLLEPPLEVEPTPRSPSSRGVSGSGSPKRETCAAAIARRISRLRRRASLAAAVPAAAVAAAEAEAEAEAVAVVAAAAAAAAEAAKDEAAAIAANSVAAIAAAALSEREVSSSSHAGVLAFVLLLPMDGLGRLEGYASAPFMRPWARCGPVSGAHQLERPSVSRQ